MWNRRRRVLGYNAGARVTTMSHADTGSAPPMLPAGLPEDWACDRDVPCPRCGYNLRGLHTPRCPECGTVFRWQALLGVACPRCGASLRGAVGEQCPECGLQLDWSRLLGDAVPVGRWNYEYASRPFWAGVRTWFAVLRPRRFWRGIPLELAPVADRLRRFRRIAWMVAVVGMAMPMLERIDQAIQWIRAGAMAGPFQWAYLQEIGSALAANATTWIVLLVPALISAASVPLFSITLGRFRIRREQLRRIWAYAAVGAAWIGLLIGAGVLAETMLRLPALGWTGFGRHDLNLPAIVQNLVYPPGLWGESPLLRWYVGRLAPPLLARLREWIPFVVGVGLVGLFPVWWWWFLYTSLRRYLRLERGTAVGIFVATQIIAGLTTLLVLCASACVAPSWGWVITYW